jgi:UDP-glucose 4-epimerase
MPVFTRFVLSVNQAVDTLFAALGVAGRGETYVPNAPSATVMNVARALIGKRPIETRVIGIRPGEKLHEIMVSEEEANHTVRRGNYYAILPMLPELRDEASIEPNALTKEFSSADNVLDPAGTVDLLHRNRLLPEDVTISSTEELLR